jgi:hypothetical protein
MSKAGGTGNANDLRIEVVNNDVPSDPVQQLADRIAQADAEIESCRAKVARQKEHLTAAATAAKKERQRQHLAGAEDALAQAIAVRKELG